jgi:hypothetical protein
LDEIRYFPTVLDERYVRPERLDVVSFVQPFWTNDTVTDEITFMDEIAGPTKYLTPMMSRRYLEKESI